MAFYLQLLLLLPTVWQLAVASTCNPPAASCAAILDASSASCSSFFSSNKISTSTCTSTSTITPATATKTVTSVSTETDGTSITDTRTIQQTKARSSTITTTTLVITSSTTTSTTTSEVVATVTIPASVTMKKEKKSWIEKIFKRAAPVIPADCSCFLTSTATKLTTAKTPTTTTTLPVATAKTITSTIRTTITISNVGTTLTSISTTFTTYTSTYTTTDSLTSTTTATCVSGSLFDNSNCGSCGNVCSEGSACYNGVCALTCPVSAGCNFISCGTGGTPDGGTCICNAIAEGGILCFEFPNLFCDFPSCSVSTDCPVGQGCVTDTCCSSPFCVPINTCNNSASPKYLFKKAPTDPTGEVSHYISGGS